MDKKQVWKLRMYVSIHTWTQFCRIISNKRIWIWSYTVYPITYACGFVIFCCVSIRNLCESFTHMLQSGFNVTIVCSLSKQNKTLIVFENLGWNERYKKKWLCLHDRFLMSTPNSSVILIPNEFLESHRQISKIRDERDCILNNCLTICFKLHNRQVVTVVYRGELNDHSMNH